MVLRWTKLIQSRPSEPSQVIHDFTCFVLLYYYFWLIWAATRACFVDKRNEMKEKKNEGFEDRIASDEIVNKTRKDILILFETNN